MNNVKKHSSTKRPLMCMNNLPQWAYTEEEWNHIQDITIDIVDGERMVYDNMQHQKNIEQNKLLLEAGSLSRFL